MRLLAHVISFALAATTLSQTATATALPPVSPLATKDRRILPKRQTTPRIVGGSPAPSSDFKYIAYIEAQSFVFGVAVCTGSLIAPNVVMTAAHCTYISSFLQFSPDDFQVGFSHTTPDQTTLFKGYAVKDVLVHPDFSKSTLKNDIALLVLNDTIPASVAEPVKLYAGDVYLDTPLTAAGFGITDPQNDTQLAAQLMQVSLHVGSTALCTQNVPWYNRDTMLCTDASIAGHDTCSADSGGPLATAVDNGAGFAVLGLTSFGSANKNNPDGLCGQKGSPGFYTRVAKYIPWIAQSVNLDAASLSISNVTVIPHESDVLEVSESESGDQEALDTIDESDLDSADATTSRKQHSSTHSAASSITGVGSAVLAMIGASL
ncbi:hypothetical protein IW150_002611 [Coemansia sp. RSA 2607]|nr:hypothetical protein IW150_002611 [Coemansia sp. RSA 2607]